MGGLNKRVRLAVVRMARRIRIRPSASARCYAAGEAKSCIGERCADVIERMASDLPLLFRKRHITCWKFLMVGPVNSSGAHGGRGAPSLRC